MGMGDSRQSSAGNRVCEHTKALATSCRCSLGNFLLACADCPFALLTHRQWPSPNWETLRRHAQTLRVVSLNCAGGNILAAREVKPYHPDIVLLQESPDRRALTGLAHELYGNSASILWGPDASIIAHGQLLPRAQQRNRSDFSQARVKLLSGIECEVVSWRLSPPIFRADLWSPTCWRQQYQDRIDRRNEVIGIYRQACIFSNGVPLIIGGDCNTPAGDGALRPLRNRLSDTFTRAGMGWGNTCINDLPFARIDQIWVNRSLRPVAVFAKKTRYSDHRLVICDLVLTSQAK